MKRFIVSLAFAPILLATSAVAGFSTGDRYALEPCINGGVSARGLFATQAEEDRYFAERRLRVDEPEVAREDGGGLTEHLK